MKKLIIFSAIFLMLCTSCNTKENNDNKPERVDKYEGKSGKITCVVENKTQAFDFKGTYTITYENGYVIDTYTREIMSLDNEDNVKAYVQKLTEEYKKYDGLEHYQYSVNQNGLKIVNNTHIDYKNIDLLNLSETSGQVVTKESLKTSTIVASYKILGAICEEE